MTHVVGVIQARMGSTRLPGKILAPICNEFPLLSLLAKRVANPEIQWWLATSKNSSDDVTAAWGDELGLQVYRGSEEDVLSRFVEISEVTNCDWLVRVTADDPFMEWQTISKLIKSVGSISESVEIVCADRANKQFPLGYVPEIFRASAIQRIQNQIPSELSYHRSNVTSYLAPEKTRFYSDASLPSRPNWRWTVDTKEDLEMVRATFFGLGANSHLASYLEIVEFLDKNPNIVNLNLGIQQKAITEG